MLFNFSLKPLEQIEPWGEPGSQQLHWFGLTDGCYWMEVGHDRLFEYAEASRQQFEAPRYCDYFVVRLYEDVLDMVPHVLAPVPADLSAYLSLQRRPALRRAYEAWEAEAEARLPESELWDRADAATGWMSRRMLDSAYLAPSARIQMWADDRNVYVEWDNRDKLIDGMQAWTATSGSFAIPRDDFVLEVQSFHDRLMEQMHHRVAAIQSGQAKLGADLDVDGLAREHELRARPISQNLMPTDAPDWNLVRSVIEELEKHGDVLGSASSPAPGSIAGP
jgi:hypothetical protein